MSTLFAVQTDRGPELRQATGELRELLPKVSALALFDILQKEEGQVSLLRMNGRLFMTGPSKLIGTLEGDTGGIPVTNEVLYVSHSPRGRISGSKNSVDARKQPEKPGITTGRESPPPPEPHHDQEEQVFAK